MRVESGMYWNYRVGGVVLTGSLSKDSIFAAKLKSESVVLKVGAIWVYASRNWKGLGVCDNVVEPWFGWVLKLEDARSSTLGFLMAG